MTKNMRQGTAGTWGRALVRSAMVAAISAGALAGVGTAVADETSNTPTPKIIGGEPADRTYSFMASLQMDRNGDPNSHWCGGALIEADWVVTAAHCVTTAGEGSDPYTVMDPALFHVRVGTKDRTTGGSVATLKDIVVHPDYKVVPGRNEGNDIALLQLDTAVSQKPATPAPKITRPGLKVREIGWGMTANDATSLPTQLQQLDTVALPPGITKCKVDQFGDDDYGIRDGDICVDNPEGVRGPCGGDSGSPLLTRVGDRWRLEGVDSRGVGDVCGESPDIYSSVGTHRDWIAGVTG